MANGGADDERFEAQVRALARTLPYPPTPDLARLAQMAHAPTQPRLRLAWVIIVLVIIASLLAVPQVRAALIEFFQIGGVRIYLAPTPTVIPRPASGTSSPTATPPPTPTLLPRSSIWRARPRWRRPKRKQDFRCYCRQAMAHLTESFCERFADNGQLVILIWLDPADPNRIRLSLHEMVCEICIQKNQPTVIRNTTVNGQPAIWAEGPYMVRLTNNDMDFRRLVEGHVLIWEVAGVTYRLETDLTLEEAVTIAESLK